MKNIRSFLKKDQQRESIVAGQLRLWSARIGHRIAARLNRYTARWPPGTWRVALAIFCLICGGCCLWLAVKGWII